MKISKFLFIALFLLCNTFLWAHPMPNSILRLDFHQDKINCRLQIPLKEMKLAVAFDVENFKNLNLKNKELVDYLNKHFKITDACKRPWKINLDNIYTESAEQNGTGKYAELVVDYRIFPVGKNPRKFIIYYDGVIHQVNSHRAIVSVHQDWENGIVGDKSLDETQIGTIAYDIDTQKPLPLYIDLQKGSNWEGFKSMVKLGMKHISEGTDHLMFLLALLLTAPLIFVNKKWKSNPSISKSILKILKITISFTAGHSLTLILATLNIITFPVKPIEIIIALSILVTAIHAIIPIFPNRENWVALVFGLIHGLAFSTVLAELQLTKSRLALSLLGFNIGIELMQLLVIFLVMPWLLFISRYKIYINFKNLLACLAITASLAWIAERLTDTENIISKYLKIFTENSILFVAFLFFVSLLLYVFKFKKIQH